MIKAEIIADSVNPAGVRLTTAVWTYPRFIHSEVMTHRMLSKNASSSRAIPVAKMIQAVQDDPAMPIHWGKNQPGMSASEQLEPPVQSVCKIIWEKLRDKAASDAGYLTNTLGLHKQVANRLLEPWTHMTTLVSGTEWANFFALRVHKDAQPEFQELAYLMLKEYVKALRLQHLCEGQWHLPFRDSYLDQATANDDSNLIRACIGRCARVSYKNQDGNFSLEDDLKLYNRIANHRPLHATPMEHVAMARNSTTFVDASAAPSNFRGWTQYRKTLTDENIAHLDFASHLRSYERETGRI